LNEHIPPGSEFVCDSVKDRTCAFFVVACYVRFSKV